MSAFPPIADIRPCATVEAVPTRYQQLRQAVTTLAASADKQVGYLDKLKESLTSGRSAAACGNDELALELDDIFSAAADMIELGELTEAEREAVQPLDGLLARWSGEENADFWQRDALVGDPRWEQVRLAAAEALARLPDEVRAVGRSA